MIYINKCNIYFLKTHPFLWVGFWLFLPVFIQKRVFRLHEQQKLCVFQT
jgi:hypothetical protein